jgi:phosphate transport system permease protein
VLIADRAADGVIRVGGIGVIVAVFGIMLFLAEVAVPLFTGGELVSYRSGRLPAMAGRVIAGRVDEYKTLAVAVTDAGEMSAFHVGSGRPLAVDAGDLGKPTAVAPVLGGDEIAFGYADGSVRFGSLGTRARVLPASEMPEGLARLDGRDRTDGKAVFSAVPGDQVRRLEAAVDVGEPRRVADRAAVVALDYRSGGTVERPTRSFVTVDETGSVRLSRAEEKKNLLTGKTTATVDTAALPDLPQGFKPVRVLMTEHADQVYVADAEGVIQRYDTRNFDAPVLAETFDALPGPERLAAFGFLIGGQSIVVGGSSGAVDIYFLLQRQGAPSKDGYALVRAHRLEPHGAAAVAFSASARNKSFATADADGNVWVRHATSEQTLLKLTPNGRDSLQALTLTPRDDGVVAIGGGRYHAWDLSVPHPETTLASIFGKVWYEGYPEPAYTWQSSSGNDAFEPKLSLVPLIFGTIKATLYSLLFAVPVALLGAIYTSEFVHHTVRASVKPVMEMMASLPSVVLGFVAALVLAPFVETWIAAVLLAFAAMPLALLAAAYGWQMLPATLALRLQGRPKFAAMFAALAVGLYAAYALAPAFERLVFAGDLKAWANGDVGSGAPFLALLLFPAVFAIAWAGAERLWGAPTQAFMRGLSRTQAALADAARWLALLLVAGVGAALAASLLGAAGVDARGGVVDTYVQRNTLVVGFAMGFAVIPIIYTIAEDALNTVPGHLRAASLACGATPWQTAVWVVLPTALSGVFAAIMVGMGRAVGETMIVVMAAGNTPILEWNVFDGLRALSANIAVELPEAVKDSTLYRMLFLAAMTLFVMTFVINTLAELVRLRFRRRAAQL